MDTLPTYTVKHFDQSMSMESVGENATMGHFLIASICVFSTFANNRFANINLHVYYNTVRGRQSQLLDSQFGLT